MAGLSSYELGCLALEQGVLMERAGFAIWVGDKYLPDMINHYVNYIYIVYVFISESFCVSCPMLISKVYLTPCLFAGSVIVFGGGVASGELPVPKPNQPSPKGVRFLYYF